MTFTIAHSSLITQRDPNDTLLSYSQAIILTGTTDATMPTPKTLMNENYWTTDLSAPGVLPSCQAIADHLKYQVSWSTLIYTLEPTFPPHVA